MKSTIRLLATIALVVAVSLGTVGFACKKESTIRTAIDSSFRLPGSINDLTDRIREGRDRGIIPANVAADFGKFLNLAAQGAQGFVPIVRAANEIFKKNGSLSAAALLDLRTYIDTNIVGHFIKALEIMRIVSGPAAALLTAGFMAARALIQSMGSGVGSLMTAAIPAVLDLISATGSPVPDYKGIAWRQYN